MKTVFIFCLVIIPTCFVCSQVKLNGVVINKNRVPLGYTNIVLLKTNVGTMSDAFGRFSITIHRDDSVRFSHIGFHSLTIAAKDAVTSDSFYLELDEHVLPKISIVGKANFRRTQEIGFFQSKGSNAFSLGEGSQLAVYLENPIPSEGWIKFLSFKLKHLKSCSSQFRIRFLEVDTISNSPGRDLLNENLLISFEKMKRNNTIDISNYHLIMPKEGIFIVMEWIATEPNCESKKFVSIAADNDLSQPIVWLNYRDRKWSRYNFSGRKVGVPNIGLTVVYP